MKRDARLSDWHRLLGAALLCGMIGGAAPVQAQERTPIPRLAIVVLDRDALYAQSAFGQRIRAELEAASQRLSAENRRIEAALVDEEQRLTEQRVGMDPAAFRRIADEFDTRVEGIRGAQDAKARRVTQQAERASQVFLELAGPVLSDLAQRTGALVVLDRRNVLAASDQVDITVRALEEINRVVGSGPGLEAMLDAQGQAPTPRPDGLLRPDTSQELLTPEAPASE